MAEDKSSKPDQKPDLEPEHPEKSKPIKRKVKKPTKGLLIGVIVAAVVILAGLLTALFLTRHQDSSDPKAKLSYSDSFFIYDNGSYTLWNKKGERLTEDAYTSKSDFIAGYAYVKKDDQVGIIREDGKMSVNFGKYGAITAAGGLYLAQDGNTKEYDLLTGAGKVVAHAADLSITSPSSTAGFAVVKNSAVYTVYNYSGQSIVSYAIKEDADEPKLSSSAKDFGLFYYDNFNIVFDVRSGKQLDAFEGQRYTFEEVSDSRALILLKSDENEPKYRLIASGKAFELNETKYYGLTDSDDIIVGYDDYDAVALLDKNYKVVKRVDAYVALKDINNYAAKNADGNVEVVVNGQVVKTFDKEPEIRSGLLYDDFYAIKNDGKYKFYELDGSEAFGGPEYAAVWDIFDKHHHAIVADAEDEYYFINTKGERVSEGAYKRIYIEEGGYEVKNSDNHYGILNLAGEPITDTKYESTYYRSDVVDHNIWTGRNAYEDHDVIDVDHKRVLLEHVNVNSFYAHYFTVKNSDGKYDYYTYDGVKFYTSEQ